MTGRGPVRVVAPRSGARVAVLLDLPATRNITRGDAAWAQAPQGTAGLEAALAAACAKALPYGAARRGAGVRARIGTGPVLDGPAGRQAGTGGGCLCAPTIAAPYRGGMIWLGAAPDACLDNLGRAILRNPMPFRRIAGTVAQAGLIAARAAHAD